MNDVMRMETEEDHEKDDCIPDRPDLDRIFHLLYLIRCKYKSPDDHPDDRVSANGLG